MLIFGGNIFSKPVFEFMSDFGCHRIMYTRLLLITIKTLFKDETYLELTINLSLWYKHRYTEAEFDFIIISDVKFKTRLFKTRHYIDLHLYELINNDNSANIGNTTSYLNNTTRTSVLNCLTSSVS